MLLNALMTAVIIAFSALLGWWVVDNNEPIEIISVSAMTPQIKAGETLKVRFNIERKRRCHVRVDHIVFDSDRLRVARSDEDFLAGSGPVGPDFFAVSFPLPLQLSSGDAVYRSVRAYYCNPLQHLLDMPIKVFTPDVKFVILPP
jgi:hypothetical protein